MNIQKKTSIILLIVILLYTVSLVSFNKIIWSKKLKELDYFAEIKNHKVMKSGLDNELNNLSLILKDYSRWDDSYNFVENINPAYIETNYNGVDYNNFSFVVIYNNDGKRLASFKINKNAQLVPWEGFPAKLPKNSFWFKTEIENIKRGLISDDFGIELVAIAPILKTSGEGLNNGYLIFGRSLSTETKLKLQKNLDIKTTFLDVSTPSNYKKNIDLIEKIKASNNNYHESISKDLTKTYSIVSDIYGNPCLIIGTESSKQFEIIGKDMQHKIMIFTFLLAIAILCTFYELMKIYIIMPLVLLKRVFRHISKKNELPFDEYKKLISKNDEISDLTEEFKILNDKIFDLNNNLENTVKSRTIELMKTNENLQLAEKIIDNTTEGIIVTDLDGKIIKANQGFLIMSGSTNEEVIGQNPKFLKSGKHDNNFYKNMWHQIKITGYWSGEIWNRKKDGTVYPKLLTINTIFTKDDIPAYYVGILTDITKLKDIENKLNHLAYYDSLTGLPNRMLFTERLNQSIKYNKRYNSSLAVFFMDLDRFKNINDNLGHSIGDEYLIEIAKRLRLRVCDTDIVCRVGGDEFLIILDKFDSNEDVSLIAADILRIIETPMILANKEIIGSTSLGISIFPNDDTTAEGLIRKADAAMYLAKDSGKGNYKFFSQEIEDQNNSKLELEIELRKALENNRFELFYQPQINIGKYMNGENSIIGCEALIRWRKEDGSLIQPDSFIPLAEETGMIVPIGKWVLEEACKTGAKWYKMGSPVRISVNVASIQFEDPDFLHYLDESLSNSGLPSELLHLELTESLLLNNIDNTVDLLNRIKERGILFSIDDFGTGYSSLSYIKELPASHVKIDKAFVYKLDNSQQDKTLVQVIISIAKTFGMTTIAEGVETRQHLEVLHEMGCEEIQGYYISRPLPQEAFEKFVETMKNNEIV